MLEFARRQCRRLRGLRSTDHEDAAQEAVIAYWRARVDGLAIGSPEGFVVRALRFQSGKLARSARQRRVFEDPGVANQELHATCDLDASVLARLRAEAPPQLRLWLDELIGARPRSHTLSDAARWKRDSRTRRWIRENFTT
ncbi:MAG: hypothetical protein H6838_11805 [Planctomycetes bacterium]|nr:hypothetical protein [Planctomycetota bacterium]MCB9886171.1 hypothetical protein [Planctomycetota bacterium]